MLYSENCIPTSHNSFASSSNGFIFWPQQHLSIKDQLKIGVRGFMLDLYKISGNIVIRHTAQSIPGITKPLIGPDIMFYDTFKEFVDFIDTKSKNNECATITILLESYVFNRETYNIINHNGLAHYLYQQDPNLANQRDVCNKIVLFTSHTKDSATGIHSPSLYKENDYNYYSNEFLGYKIINPFEYEGCKERLDGRAKYTNPDVKIFCFNHFSPVSALLTLNICVKPILHKLAEIIDQSIPFDCGAILAENNLFKSMKNLNSLSAHLDQCKLQNIKNKFHPTIIAVDFIEKDSEVFLCYEDQNCSGRKCNLPTDVSSAWSLEKVAIVGAVSIGVISYCYLMGCCGNQNDQHFHADQYNPWLSKVTESLQPPLLIFY